MASPMLPEPHGYFGVGGPGWPASSPTTEAAEALIIPTRLPGGGLVGPYLARQRFRSFRNK